MPRPGRLDRIARRFGHEQVNVHRKASATIDANGRAVTPSPVVTTVNMHLFPGRQRQRNDDDGKQNERVLAGTSADYLLRGEVANAPADVIETDFFTPGSLRRYRIVSVAYHGKKPNVWCSFEAMRVVGA